MRGPVYAHTRPRRAPDGPAVPAPAAAARDRPRESGSRPHHGERGETGAAEATDTLIVYFAGHGLIDPQDTLSLALPHTESGRVETGLPYDWLRQVLLMDSRAERHVVILGCCYSGLALGRMNAASPGLADQASVEGSFLLAAAAETRTALAPVGDTYTAFTGALLDTLNRGIPGGPTLLDLGTVYRRLRRTLRPRGHPVPQARGRNNGAEVALGPNHAVLPDHTAAPARPARPGHTVRAGGKGNGRRHALIGIACATAPRPPRRRRALHLGPAGEPGF
ncbi:caspase family protein [Streptomyces anulatus]|uniref:caspase, EACC1-associated type n=1 Tax=Streptomyces anulatus TaxID=1892 RepID=UPI00365A45B4